MVYSRSFFIGIVLAGIMLLPMTVHAFDMNDRHIICQSETETQTQTEAPTEEATDKKKKKTKKKSQGGSEEESNPEEDCGD